MEISPRVVVSRMDDVVVLGDTCQTGRRKFADLIVGDFTHLEYKDIGIVPTAAPYRNFRYGLAALGQMIFVAGYWNEKRKKLCGYVIEIPGPGPFTVREAVGKSDYQRVLSQDELQALVSLKQACEALKEPDRLEMFPGASRRIENDDAIPVEDSYYGDCAELLINAAAAVEVKSAGLRLRITTIGQTLFVTGH